MLGSYFSSQNYSLAIQWPNRTDIDVLAMYWPICSFSCHGGYNTEINVAGVSNMPPRSVVTGVTGRVCTVRWELRQR